MSEFLLSLYQLILPALLPVISTALGVMLLRLSSVAKERWGIEIEARLRETLHSALMTGISMAASKGLRGEAAVQAAVAHVITKGAPAAVDYFGLGLEDLAEMAGGKLHDALTDMPQITLKSYLDDMFASENAHLAAPTSADKIIR